MMQIFFMSLGVLSPDTPTCAYEHAELTIVAHNWFAAVGNRMSVK